MLLTLGQVALPLQVQQEVMSVAPMDLNRAGHLDLNRAGHLDLNRADLSGLLPQVPCLL
jgi:hypothetical protein